MVGVLAVLAALILIIFVSLPHVDTAQIWHYFQDSQSIFYYPGVWRHSPKFAHFHTSLWIVKTDFWIKRWVRLYPSRKYHFVILRAVAMECQAMGIPTLLNDMKQAEASVCPKHVHHRIDGNSAAAYVDLILTYFDKKGLYCEAAETASAYARKQFDKQKINQKIIKFLGMNHTLRAK